MRSLLFEALFEPGEGICWAPNKYGTDVWPLEQQAQHTKESYFCLNPLLLNKNLRPTKPRHSRMLGCRADHNVTCFRNILVEFDEIPLDAQLEALKSVPYCTLVYSGGKSYHAIIRLEEPVETKDEYRALVKRIYAKLETSLPDEQCCNPSRLTRNPGAMRGGVEQAIVEVTGKQISKAELLGWLGEAPVVQKVEKLNDVGQVWKHILTPWTRDYLLWGAEEGGRNTALFNATCDMCRAGYEEEEVYEKVSGVCDLPDEEIVETIKSAFNRVKSDQTYNQAEEA